MGTVPNFAAKLCRLNFPMRLEIETWLRGSNVASTQTVDLPITEPAGWTDADVQLVLEELLRAIERASDPEADRQRPVRLRGFNWIVSPFDNAGVLVQIEIQLGAAAAGPFPVAQAELDAMIARVLATERARQADAFPPSVH
jgi:hypothetical protein